MIILLVQIYFIHHKVYLYNLDYDLIFCTITYILKNNPKCVGLFVIRIRRSIESLFLYGKEWNLNIEIISNSLLDNNLYHLCKMTLI